MVKYFTGSFVLGNFLCVRKDINIIQARYKPRGCDFEAPPLSFSFFDLCRLPRYQGENVPPPLTKQGAPFRGHPDFWIPGYDYLAL